MSHETMLLLGGGVLIILMLYGIFSTTKPQKTQKTEPTVVEPTHDDPPINNSHIADQHEPEQHESNATSLAQNSAMAQTKLTDHSSAHHPMPHDDSSQTTAESTTLTPQEQSAEERWQHTLKAMFKRRIEARSLEANADIQSATAASNSSLLVVYLMAKRSKPYKGKVLLKHLAGFHFVYSRKRQVFHHLDSNKQLLFQVCQARKPGTFDIETMQKHSTDGLAFLLDLNTLTTPKATFKLMLETMCGLSKKLGGDLLDDHKNRLTESSVSMYLAKIKGIESSRKKQHDH